MMDQEISRALKVGTATVERVRRRCVEEGVDAALGRREQLRRRQRKLDGQSEAHLTPRQRRIRVRPRIQYGAGYGGRAGGLSS